MDLILTPMQKNRWKLIGDFTYKEVVVPKGYITNGADIPRLFWTFYPPNKSDFMEAVVIHDYLCDKEEYLKADIYFEEILKLNKVKKKDIFILVGGVRFYHFVRYSMFKKISISYKIAVKKVVKNGRGKS